MGKKKHLWTLNDSCVEIGAKQLLGHYDSWAEFIQAEPWKSNLLYNADLVSFVWRMSGYHDAIYEDQRDNQLTLIFLIYAPLNVQCITIDAKKADEELVRQFIEERAPKLL